MPSPLPTRRASFPVSSMSADGVAPQLPMPPPQRFHLGLGAFWTPLHFPTFDFFSPPNFIPCQHSTSLSITKLDKVFLVLYHLSMLPLHPDKLPLISLETFRRFYCLWGFFIVPPISKASLLFISFRQILTFLSRDCGSWLSQGHLNRLKSSFHLKPPLLLIFKHALSRLI